MSAFNDDYVISNIEGDVLLHHRVFGWVRAEAGMTLPECISVKIKTGTNSTVEILNAYGRRLKIPPKRFECINRLFARHEISFRQVLPRDIMAASSRMRVRLSPVG